MAFNESTSDWSRSLSRGQRVRFHALPVGQQIARITNEQPVVLITGALTAWAAQTEMNLMTARRSHFDEVYPTKAQLARIARLTMMAELAASIAHEISDPLCAVVTSAEACLRWLNRDEPDLDEARDAVSSIASEGIRAGEMIRGLQALLTDSDEQQELIPEEGSPPGFDIA